MIVRSVGISVVIMCMRTLRIVGAILVVVFGGTGCADLRPTMTVAGERVSSVLVIPVKSDNELNLHGYKYKPDLPWGTLFFGVAGMPVDLLYYSLSKKELEQDRERDQSLITDQDVDLADYDLTSEFTGELIRRATPTYSMQLAEERPASDAEAVAADILASSDTELVVFLEAIPSLSEGLTRFRLDVLQRSFRRCTEMPPPCAEAGPDRFFTFLGDRFDIPLIEKPLPEAQLAAKLLEIDQKRMSRLKFDPDKASAINQRFEREKKRLMDVRITDRPESIKAFWTKERIGEQVEIASSELTHAVLHDWNQTSLDDDLRRMVKRLRWETLDGKLRTSKVTTIKYEQGRSLHMLIDGGYVSAPGQSW